MANVKNEGYVPPLEKAHRLMNEGKTEYKWSEATGFIDRVLRELEKAESEGLEWGKPVHDPRAHNPFPIIYKDKQDFINQRIQPYLDRHQHLKGYIRDYAKDRAKQTQENIELEPKANPPGYNGRRKVTPEKIDLIFHLKEKGMTQQQIADEVGATRQRVSQILLDGVSANNGYNITNTCATVEPDKSTKKVRGTSQGYLIGRLKRDFPDVLDKIGKDKEYKSVREAAIAVGIVKHKSPLIIPAEPVVLANNLQTKCDADYLAEMVEGLGAILPTKDSGGQIASKLYQKLDDAQLRELYLNLMDYLGSEF